MKKIASSPGQSQVDAQGPSVPRQIPAPNPVNDAVPKARGGSPKAGGGPPRQSLHELTPPPGSKPHLCSLGEGQPPQPLTGRLSLDGQRLTTQVSDASGRPVQMTLRSTPSGVFTAGGLRGGTDPQQESSAAGGRRARQLSDPEQPQLTQRARTQERPATQGLDTARLLSQTQALNTFLNGLTQTQVNTLATRFGQLHVREDNIVNFSGTRRDRSAIVNAANDQLGGGSGVNGAVQTAAGGRMLAWCQDDRNCPRINYQGRMVRCPTGMARVSPGFGLRVGSTIHAVGPQLTPGTNPSATDQQELRSAYQNSYAHARNNQLQELAVSALSTGIYGYPVEDGCGVMMQEALRELVDHGSLNRLQLTSFNPRGGSDANYTALAYLWDETRRFLDNNATVPVTQTAPVPRAATSGTAGTSSTSGTLGTSSRSAGTSSSTARSQAVYPRDPLNGQYTIHRPHLSQPVHSYYPPGTGYHHEVQHNANCGLHVHQQQLMFYSGNNFDLLASQAAVNAHIATLGAAEDHVDEARRQASVSQRQTLYEFSDLASFSLAQTAAPQFQAVQGANLQLGQALTLPFNSTLTRQDIDAMPAIGVTLRQLDGQGEQREHSVQIIRLRDGSFIEVDPQRNPASSHEQPRQLQGSTMSQALEHLVSTIGQDHVFVDPLGRRQNMGRNFDLLLPTPQTLQAYQARNLPLPQAQTVPPLPTPQAAPPGAGGARPGVQEPQSHWLAPFLGTDNEAAWDAQISLGFLPDDAQPLVAHYAQTLWQDCGVYAHTPHFTPAQQQELNAFAQRFGGSELLVTFNRRDGGGSSQPQQILLQRQGDQWQQLDEAGGTSALGEGLAGWLRDQLAQADGDGLRLLRRPPSNAEWLAWMAAEDPHYSTRRALAEALVWHLQNVGVVVDPRSVDVVDAATGQTNTELIGPSAIELEFVAMSMLGRGAVAPVLPDPDDPQGTIDVRAVVAQSRQHRTQLQQRLDGEIDALLGRRQALEAQLRLPKPDKKEVKRLQREVDDAAAAVVDMRQAIYLGQEAAIGKLLRALAVATRSEGVTADHMLKVDLNEFSLMLAPSFTAQEIEWVVEANPPTGTHTSRGRDGSRGNSNPVQTQQTRANKLASVLRFVLDHSPTPRGSQWTDDTLRERDGDPRYSLNAGMLGAHADEARRENTRRREQYDQDDTSGPKPTPQPELERTLREARTAVYSIEAGVAPLGPNPLDTPDARHVFEDATRDRKQHYLTTALGITSWMKANLTDYRSTHGGEDRPVQRARPSGPAAIPRPDVSRLDQAHQTAAESALAILRSYRVVHPESGLNDGTLSSLMTSYVHGLVRLQNTTLAPALVNNPDILLDHDVAQVLQLFGGTSSGNAGTDRAALVNLASSPTAAGRPHPCQLSRDILLLLPQALQNALFTGSTPQDQSIRRAFNLVDGLELQGSRLTNYAPRLYAHQALLERVGSSTQLASAPKSLARNLMYELDRAWQPWQPVTLLDVARGDCSLPEVVRRRLELDGNVDPRRVQNQQQLFTWIKEQDFDDTDQPTLKANVELLNAFARDAGDDAQERQIFRAVASDWMRAVEDAHLTDLHHNPVWDAFMQARNQDDFVDTALRLFPNQEVWIGNALVDPGPILLRLYQSWSSATSVAPADLAAERASSSPWSPPPLP